jgi:hypothetical protein
MKPLCAANAGGIGNRLKCIWSCCLRDPQARVWWPTRSEDIRDYAQYYLDPPIPAIASYAELFADDLSITPAQFDSYELLRWDWRIWVGDRAPVAFLYSRTPPDVIRQFFPL